MSSHEKSIGTSPFQPDYVSSMLAFLEEIGIPWVEAKLEETTFLPGLAIRQGTLVVDRSALAYPGDILHEAAHIAMTEGSQRTAVVPKGMDEPGFEIAALAWSFAAAVHTGIPPEVVFHEGGYKGQATQIRLALQSGATLGQPVLAWLGMTEYGVGVDPARAFPRMQKWLRD